jgi:sulfur carrier protein
MENSNMEVTVIFGKKEENRVIPEETTIKEVLDAMDISSETVVVKRNNEIVIEEEFLVDGDVIEVIRVIYGG